ncbi:MAG TPA: malate synthase A [Micromonosporaceae bacterium]|nr:malate synthase A [Micromonosporaceae bacterium]
MSVDSAANLTTPGREPDELRQTLGDDALALIVRLHREFEPVRRELMNRRAERAVALANGAIPDFLAETREIRESAWTVAPAAPGLIDRRVELTGPTDRKTVINALNSGAKVFMADFEDSNTPSFDNMVTGQVNLLAALQGTLDFTNPDGKHYALGDEVATLVVRPRGWHLMEKHVLVDGEPVSGALFDVAAYLAVSARAAIAAGIGPYFYLPKLESHREARLWNDVFNAAQDQLGLPRGTIRATVLIETVLAAFEMDEILYELREHAAGLNAGRWDYIFSVIKKLRDTSVGAPLPDRTQVTMTVPFMRNYTELLVKTCHARGAYAIGGMSAFIPNRRNPEVNDRALAAVRADKQREAADGFDGSWVAHPDLVPIALEAFDARLGGRPNQLDRQRPDVTVTAADLLAIAETPGTVTEAGLRNNVSVSLQYLESWLRGVGAVAIFDLMEDAATAEISRSQIWQWIHDAVRTAEGTVITAEYVRGIEHEELAKIRAAVGDQAFDSGRYDDAQRLFEQVALSADFVEFLTLPASELIG